ncbi:MAG TPA: ribonuclease HII [Candidatus Aminicenantes bacterium]|nr:ribonuclease HII [Candidatus Aminicenantes bacterium]
MTDFSLEREQLDQGCRFICGVDEVGRGALFGPVVAGAVILDPLNLDFRIRDSKRLSARRRVELATVIYAIARAWSIGWCWNDAIDRINILQATRVAMARAVAGLQIPPDYVLIDGMKPDFLPVRGAGILHGDDCSLSVAAASIIAKVFRDDLMIRMAGWFPEYELSANKGYPSVRHILALKHHGTTPFHRRSFRKVLWQ